jgi:hypothetical protein
LARPRGPPDPSHSPTQPLPRGADAHVGRGRRDLDELLEGRGSLLDATERLQRACAPIEGIEASLRAPAWSSGGIADASSGSTGRKPTRRCPPRSTLANGRANTQASSSATSSSTVSSTAHAWAPQVASFRSAARAPSNSAGRNRQSIAAYRSSKVRDPSAAIASSRFGRGGSSAHRSRSSCQASRSCSAIDGASSITTIGRPSS